MAVAGIPQNFNIQQGNGQVFLTWSQVAGADSYEVQRCTDNVSWQNISNPGPPYYLDSTVTVGTLYFYRVASVVSGNIGTYTNSLNIVPTRTGDLALSQVRLLSQQRADRVNSNFVSLPEWNSYINQSYFELYDLLVTVYEDYFVQTPYSFTTNGSAQYTLPTDFYKLLGVDLGIAANTNAFVSVKKFEFISRNRYLYPNLTANALGLFNMRYRLVGNTLFFIPTPSAGQSIRVWYVPKLTQLLQDNDILTGISGWSEYVIVDAAIKALQKEESDVSVLMAQKMALKQRIEESAMNRDAGAPDTISDTRTWTETWGGGSDGPMAGF